MADLSLRSPTAATVKAVQLAPVSSGVQDAPPSAAADEALAQAAVPMADLSLPSLTPATAKDVFPAPVSAGVQNAAPSAAADEVLAQAAHLAAATDERVSQRSESEKANPTVAFERYVFLFYKGVEDIHSDPLPRLFADAIKDRQSDFTKSTTLAICEGKYGSGSLIGDVLIFPDRVQYRGLSDLDVNNFTDTVLVKNTEWTLGSLEPITSSYIFVCCDGSSDKRRGDCGRRLVTRFREEVGRQSLDGQVVVTACSKMGSDYAGNVMLFLSDGQALSWSGEVTDDEVPSFLRDHIVDRLTRDLLRMSEEQQKLALVATEHQADPVMKGKVLTPAGFDGSASLHQSAIHGFHTAQQLCDAINKTNKQLSTKMAAALLFNGPIFAVNIKHASDEQKWQLRGAVCLLENAEIGMIRPDCKLYTSKVRTTPLQERKSEKTPLGDIFIERRDFGGNLWNRRRFSVEGNDDYHVLQWLP